MEQAFVLLYLFSFIYLDLLSPRDSIYFVRIRFILAVVIGHFDAHATINNKILTRDKTGNISG
jgi:hypothetical protein